MSTLASLFEAQRLVKRERARGLAMLNEIFRAGTPPVRPLDGRYAGELIALDIAPGLTQLAGTISAAWMPWQGKAFDATRVYPSGACSTSWCKWRRMRTWARRT